MSESGQGTAADGDRRTADGERPADGERARDTGSGLPDRRELLPYLGIVALYAATILGGLALADEMAARGLVIFANPGEVGNVGVLAVLLVAVTGIMVLAFRYDRGMVVIRAYFLLAAGMLVGTLFVVVTGIGTVATGSSLAAGLPTSPAPVAVSLATATVLWVYPEWWVNNLAAVVFGAAGIPMLGLGFGPLPIVVLLVVWAGYDAYAVYVSGHMQELATGMGDLKLPLVFIVPYSLSFSMREDGLDLGLDTDDDEEEANEGGAGVSATDETDEEEREGAPVALLGLGDAIIPGMLAVSAGHFLDAPAIVPALNANAPAIGAVVGGLVGMAGLLYLTHRVEGAHAGLPPLNAGVLAGYLVGAVAAGIPVTTALGL